MTLNISRRSRTIKILIAPRKMVIICIYTAWRSFYIVITFLWIQSVSVTLPWMWREMLYWIEMSCSSYHINEDGSKMNQWLMFRWIKAYYFEMSSLKASVWRLYTFKNRWTDIYYSIKWYSNLFEGKWIIMLLSFF